MLKIKNFLKSKGIIIFTLFLVIVIFNLVVPTYGVMPTPHSGMERTNNGKNYRTIGFTLTIGSYTTAISRETSAVRRTQIYDSDPIGDGDHTTVYYDEYKHLVISGVNRISYEGTIKWFWYEVILMHRDFDSDNPVMGRSLLDNMLLESPEAYNYVQHRLYNYDSTVGWVNAITSFYDGDKPLSTWPAMKKNGLWKDGTSAYVTYGTLDSSNPTLYPAGEIYCTNKVVDMAKARGMSKTTQADLQSMYNIRVTLPRITKIDTSPPTVTFSPNSRYWGNKDVPVIITVHDPGSELDRYRIRYSSDGGKTWGSWSSYYTSSSTTVTLKAEARHRIRVQAWDKAGNSASFTSGDYYIDKTPPFYVDASITEYDYKENDYSYWFKPGSYINWFVRGYDLLSGMSRINSRFYGSNIEAYTSYYQGQVSTWGTWNYLKFNSGYYQHPAGYMELNANATVSSNITTVIRNIDLQYYYEDNATNTAGYSSTGIKINIDGVSPTINVNRNNNNLNINCTDEGSGFASLRYALTTSSAKPGSFSSWYSTNGYKVTLTQSGTWYLHVEARDNVGNVTYSRFGGYTYVSNTPPSITISKNIDVVTEGKNVRISVKVTDPDVGDKLSSRLELKLNNNSWVVVASYGSGLTPGTTYNYYLNNIKPGNYEFRAFVNDLAGEGNEDYLSFSVQPLNINGKVKHTEKWDNNRKKYNLAKSGNEDLPRSYDVFFPGEKFMLEANPHGDHQPYAIEVRIVGTSYKTQLTRSSFDHWTGSLWHEDMLSLEDQILQFEFIADYIDIIKKEIVNVSIVSDGDYFRLRRFF